jgi:hypothetical protein
MLIPKGSNMGGGIAAEQWVEESTVGVCLRTGTSSGNY